MKQALVVAALLLPAVWLFGQTGGGATGNYNCSALHEVAAPPPTVPSCVGYNQYTLYENYNVSVLSTINNTTLYPAPPAVPNYVTYTVAATGVCIGLNSNWTPYNPTWTPANSTTSTSYVVTDSVLEYYLATFIGMKVPIVESQTIPSPALSPAPPITNCPCTSQTCSYEGCSCCQQYYPAPDQSMCCGGFEGGCSMTPVWVQAACAYECENVSPIILDIDGNGYHLTSAAGGVLFDFFGNHQPIQMSWTMGGSTNAFLALDRNGNGMIDDGSELFGNLTPQPPCNGRNGWAALAVFDTPAYGGNGDGIIDAKDAVYAKLLLWQDLNHDGISQPNELFSLSALGVAAISLSDTYTPFVDKWGNRYRYRSTVLGTKDSDLARSAYDIFFTVP
jgi:hypothetical protein